jgi:hypothetical protein
MQFLHLGVYFEKPTAPDRAAIEEVLNKATDWFRYAPNCWIVYTKNSPNVWKDRLRKIPNMDDGTSFFICELNIDNRSGWIRQTAWDWINKNRAGHPPRLASPGPIE